MSDQPKSVHVTASVPGKGKIASWTMTEDGEHIPDPSVVDAPDLDAPDAELVKWRLIPVDNRVPVTIGVCVLKAIVVAFMAVAFIASCSSSSPPTPTPTIAPEKQAPTPRPTASPASTATPQVTPSPTATPSPTPSQTPSPTPSPAPTDSPSPKPTSTPSPSPTPSPAPTATPSPAPTASPSPTDTPSPRHFYFGAFARAGQPPYGIIATANAPWTVDPTKTQNILDLGVQMARLPYESFFDDLTYLFGAGHYDFSRDDAVMAWLIGHGIIPYVDLEAAPVEVGNGATGRYKSAADFGTWCGAVANHIKTTYPQIGTTMPAMFGTPGNEPNNNWDALNAAAYMKTCYSALHAVFPVAKVYGGELSIGSQSPNDAPTFVGGLYANGCKVGTCFDGLSIHLSPLDEPVTACFESGKGWTSLCVDDLQTIATSHGDPTLHILITETGAPAVKDPLIYNSFDAAGQAAWLTDTFNRAKANPTNDGIFWANIDEDASYVGTPFHDWGLVGINGIRRPSFAAYQAFTGH